MGTDMKYLFSATALTLSLLGASTSALAAPDIPRAGSADPVDNASFRGWVAVDHDMNTGDGHMYRRTWYADTDATSYDATWAADGYRVGAGTHADGTCYRLEIAGEASGPTTLSVGPGGNSDLDTHGLPVPTEMFVFGDLASPGRLDLIGIKKGGEECVAEGWSVADSAVETLTSGIAWPYAEVPPVTAGRTYSWISGVAQEPRNSVICMTRDATDTDADGLPDLVDLAPDAPGPPQNLGSPSEVPYDEIPSVYGGPSGKHGLPSCPATTSQLPGQGIDWSVEPRMEDDNDNGILDNRYVEGALSDELLPDQDVVTTMTVCKYAGEAPVAWTIDGNPFPDSGCEITMVDSEGSYDVVAEFAGVRATETVTPEHYVVVGLGDSYGSGEGAPHRSGGKARWDQAACHRSRYAAQAQAALRLEKRDPYSAVTFVHLACSGATAVKGVVGPYPDPPGGGYQTTQVSAALEHAQGNQVDAVLLSLGGNDIGFASIITKCLLDTKAPCPKKLHDPTQKKLSGPLPQGYDDVASCLGDDATGCPAGMTTGLGVDANAVFITEYPNLATKPSGAYCNHVLAGLEDEELKWATEVVQQGEVGDRHTVRWTDADDDPHKFTVKVVAPGLNTRINGGMLSGWTPVSGIFDASVGHGYCAKNKSWVVSMSQSLKQQGNHTGAFHPNYAGQNAYGREIADALATHFRL